MRRKLALACLALAAALALGVGAALAGTAGRAADPGITSKSILLGATAPLTGATSAYASIARGADAYFRYVNARGGVLGRSIAYRVLDDGGNPARTVQATRQLVEQDKVLAVFNPVGTEQALAVRDYLNSAKVPQLFVASGATTWGRDSAKYPWSIGFQPSYEAEGWVYGKYLARTARAARVAVLFQNDDDGRDLLRGLKKGLQRSAARVIAAQPYEASAWDVDTQMARLKASGADTLAVFAAPAFTVQAFTLAHRLGWKPKRVIVNAASTSSSVMERAAEGGNRVVDGALSTVFLEGPTDPAWKGSAAMKLYARIMKQYAPEADTADTSYVYGMAAAWTAVEALKRAGKNLSRVSLRDAVGSLNASGNPFLLPGITVKTSAGDHFPIEQMVLQRWHNGAWRSFGGLWAHRTS